MARLLPKINNPFDTYDLEDVLGKLERLKIYSNRNLRGFIKADVDGPPGSYEYDNNTFLPGVKEHHDQIYPGYTSGMPETQIDTAGYLSEQANRQSRVGKQCTDYISIIDIDYKPEDKEKRHYKYIQLPFVPSELNYSPESNFVGIASFGRNNPFYQFTGSEDTLTFEIDWFSREQNREDVIFNCRWLEALTKGDAYDDVPHRVLLSWGQDNKLFIDSEWLVVAAPYRLSDFVRGYTGENGEIITVGMLPQQAYQSITLKRITKLNRTTKQIIGNLGTRQNY